MWLGEREAGFLGTFFGANTAARTWDTGSSDGPRTNLLQGLGAGRVCPGSGSCRAPASHVGSRGLPQPLTATQARDKQAQGI